MSVVVRLLRPHAGPRLLYCRGPVVVLGEDSRGVLVGQAVEKVLLTIYPGSPGCIVDTEVGALLNGAMTASKRFEVKPEERLELKGHTMQLFPVTPLSELASRSRHAIDALQQGTLRVSALLSCTIGGVSVTYPLIDGTEISLGGHPDDDIVVPLAALPRGALLLSPQQQALRILSARQEIHCGQSRLEPARELPLPIELQLRPAGLRMAIRPYAARASLTSLKFPCS